MINKCYLSFNSELIVVAISFAAFTLIGLLFTICKYLATHGFIEDVDFCSVILQIFCAFFIGALVFAVRKS